MARRALQPGELGNITTTKVSKQGKAWVVNQDNGTHWRASVLVGRRGNTPKRIRTIASSKRQAVKQCEEQAKQYIDDAKRASGAITPQSTPMEVWDAYAQSQRHQALAPATRRNYETAIADSQHENPHWWHLPLNKVGQPGLSIHGIRKTVGSIIFDTYGARAAAAWLAHSNVQTTIAYYVKLDGAMPEGPVNLLNRGE